MYKSMTDIVFAVPEKEGVPEVFLVVGVTGQKLGRLLPL
jgi:hypothetical protein